MLTNNESNKFLGAAAAGRSQIPKIRNTKNAYGATMNMKYYPKSIAALIMFCASTPVLAESCRSAVESLNATNRSNSAVYVQQFRAAFGTEPKDTKPDWDSVDFCRKMLPISKSRLAREIEFDRLDNAFMKKCPQATTKDPGADPGLKGRNTASNIMEGIRAQIGMCEKTLAGK